jgi:hypothetical protein
MKAGLILAAAACTQAATPAPGNTDTAIRTIDPLNAK